MSDAPQGERIDADLAQFIRDRGPHCLIVVRHGETEWNAAGRLQGQQDTSLNERGQGQAAAMAHFLKDLPLLQIHASTLQRCRDTARAIAQVNIARPQISHSELLKETALGVLEGEMKDHQSTAELTDHYEKFSIDEIHYRIPKGENLHDVFARIARFFSHQPKLLNEPGIHLVVGHRNANKMILKSLLGLSFEEGFCVEHEHQRLYFYFAESKELWSCHLGEPTTCFTRGYPTVTGDSYA